MRDNRTGNPPPLSAEDELAIVQSQCCISQHQLAHEETLHGAHYAVNVASGMAEAALQAIALCCGSAQTAVFMDALMQRIILANVPNRMDASITIRNTDGSIAVVNAEGRSPFPPKPDLQ